MANMTERKQEFSSLFGEQWKKDLAEMIAQDSADYENPKEYLEDVMHYGCVSGCANSVIYDKDTKAFYVKYIEEIDLFISQYEDEIGERITLDNPRSNYAVWFCYETIADIIYRNLYEDE